MNLTFDNAKLLAVIGAVLGLLSAVSATLGLVGLILYLLGLYTLSKHYRDTRIFTYALIAELAGIIAFALLAIAVALIFYAATVPPPGPMAENHATLLITALGALALAILVGAAIATGYFKKRLMEVLAPHASDPGLAGLAAKLYWYGGILSIILIGLILIFIASIIEIIVLWGLQPPTQETETTTPQYTA